VRRRIGSRNGGRRRRRAADVAPLHRSAIAIATMTSFKLLRSMIWSLAARWLCSSYRSSASPLSVWLLALTSAPRFLECQPSGASLAVSTLDPMDGPLLTAERRP